eukprot:TRINITY_DN4589_c0_g1_i9.p1 TRINITY_DN4589_c0_g1~~TRINITY_DN4589_c0_g1_i9.p1  ORF type:complete len:796 (-),score=46.58 TRINITY_DN4589_c0_g1_i9:421-2736(-)
MIGTSSETISTKHPIVGFVGVGIMGKAMVMNLINTGYDVRVWTKTAEKCEQLQQIGAKVCGSAAEVAKQSDIIFGRLSESNNSLQVVVGPQGIVAGLNSNKGYVDVSTIDTERSLMIAKAVKETGAQFIQAPVLGSVELAKQGQLIFLAAGDKRLYDLCAGPFDIMSKAKYYLGDVCASGKMKLVVNMIMGSWMASLSEGLVLAQRVGLNQQDLLEILGQGVLANELISTKGIAMIQRSYPTEFPLKHQHKHLKLALGLGEETNTRLPVASAANQLYQWAEALGQQDADFSAVMEPISIPYIWRDKSNRRTITRRGRRGGRLVKTQLSKQLAASHNAKNNHRFQSCQIQTAMQSKVLTDGLQESSSGEDFSLEQYFPRGTQQDKQIYNTQTHSAHEIVRVNGENNGQHQWQPLSYVSQVRGSPQVLQDKTTGKVAHKNDTVQGGQYVTYTKNNSDLYKSFNTLSNKQNALSNYPIQKALDSTKVGEIHARDKVLTKQGVCFNGERNQFSQTPSVKISQSQTISNDSIKLNSVITSQTLNTGNNVMHSNAVVNNFDYLNQFLTNYQLAEKKDILQRPNQRQISTQDEKSLNASNKMLLSGYDIDGIQSQQNIMSSFYNQMLDSTILKSSIKDTQLNQNDIRQQNFIQSTQTKANDENQYQNKHCGRKTRRGTRAGKRVKKVKFSNESNIQTPGSNQQLTISSEVNVSTQEENKGGQSWKKNSDVKGILKNSPSVQVSTQNQTLKNLVQNRRTDQFEVNESYQVRKSPWLDVA